MGREDKQKELQLETMKREDPEGYRLLLKEQEEAKKSYEELKKRKRLMAAAEERKRREEDGISDEIPEEDRKGKRRRTVQRQQETSPWLKYALGACTVAFIIFNVLNHFHKDKEDKDD